MLLIMSKKHIFLSLIFLISSFVFSQEKLDIFDVARKGTLEQAKEIIKNNPNASTLLNADGYSALILASYKGNIEVAKFLIDNGSDINGNSSMGTPLMAAVVKGNSEIVKLLLEKKADVSISDPNGTTALIYSSIFKNYNIATMLVKANANPESRDNRGKSAIDYAILANDDKLIEILNTK